MTRDPSPTATPESAPPSGSLTADRPILSRAEDRLGRAGFADALAKAVYNWRGADSLVIGVLGPWGSGKSSVKNLILEALRNCPDERRPDVHEFNPWQFAGQDQVLAAFFREIGSKLGHKETSELSADLARSWRRYEAAINVSRSVADATGPVLRALLGLVGLWLMGSAFDLGLLDWWARFAAGALLVVASILDWSAGLAGAVSRFFATKAEGSQRSAQDIKKSLTDLLEKRSKPLLVVIDDVDRLGDRDVQLVFQLIKANADLPNLVYLVLFQRDLVEASLNRLIPNFGAEYLEKTVQAPFDLPTADRKQVEQVLFEGLDALLKIPGVESQFDRRYWGNVYLSGLREYFTTLRNVKRFLSTLSLHARVFTRDDLFEVNLVDLIAIEALGLFEPGVYGHLTRSKDLLTDRNAGRRLSGHGEEAKRDILRIVEAAPEGRRAYAEGVIRVLFPPAEWAFGGSRYGDGFEDEWWRKLRVCSARIFDRYFHLSVSEAELTQRDVARLLSSTASRSTLAEELRGLARRGLLLDGLDRLAAEVAAALSASDYLAVITAVMDVGDLIPDKFPTFTEIPPHLRAWWVVKGVLERVEDQEAREAILERALQDTEGVFIPCLVVAYESDKAGDAEERRHRFVGDQSLARLKALAVTRIRESATAGELLATSRHGMLLSKWREWGGQTAEGEYRAFARDAIRTPEDAVAFLRGFISQGTKSGWGDAHATRTFGVSLEFIEPYVEIDALEHALEPLDLAALGVEGRGAVRAFRAALRRRRENPSSKGEALVDEYGHEDGY